MFAQRLCLVICLLFSFNCFCNYAVQDGESACEDLIVSASVIVEHDVAGAIGFDFAIEYDASKFIPTNNLVVTDNSVPSEFFAFELFVQPVIGNTGTINGSIFLLPGSASNLSWNIASGSGFFTIDFAKSTNLNAGEQVSFSINEVIESYPTGILTYFNNEIGTISSISNFELNASLNYWHGFEPISYNPALPVQYSPTLITASNNSCQATGAAQSLPELTGAFQLNMDNAQSIRISKDIDDSQSVISVINGFDAVLTLKVLLNDISFVPNVFQMMAMDVNQDGAITAGDVSQINLRTILEIGAFNQVLGTEKDWVFIDKSTSDSEAAYQISENYPGPDDLGGFHKLHVPIAPECILPPALSDCEYMFEVYIGVLLGDVDGSWKDIEVDGSLKTQTESMEANISIESNNSILLGLHAGSSIESLDIDWHGITEIDLLPLNETIFHRVHIQRQKRLESMSFIEQAEDCTLRIMGDSESIIRALEKSVVYVNGKAKFLNLSIYSNELNKK